MVNGGTLATLVVFIALLVFVVVVASAVIPYAMHFRNLLP